MDQMKKAVTARRMAEARATLIRDYPFFGHLSMGLQLACAPCETACTDGERLIFDPEFAEKLTTGRGMEFVVLHEILHIVLGHCTRGGARDEKLFNLACDIVVNSTILQMWGLNTFLVAGAEPIHLTPKGDEGRNYSAEEVYEMLPKSSGGNVGSTFSAGGNGTLDRHDVWKGIRDTSRVQDTWTMRIRNAVRACQDMPGMSPVQRKLVEKLNSLSRTDWRQLLHDFIQHDTYDYTFLPPDRRFSDRDFFLPAFNVNEDQGSARDLWVCVDTSGSVSDEELNEAMSEVRDAMRQVSLTGAISYFDTDITEPRSFDTEDELEKIIPEGGGGTSFQVIFHYLKEHLSMDLPKAILIFSDGYVCRWPKEEDALGVPVLWLISKGGNTDVPWGTVAEL